jgi:hypothetical protein
MGSDSRKIGLFASESKKKFKKISKSTSKLLNQPLADEKILFFQIFFHLLVQLRPPLPEDFSVRGRPVQGQKMLVGAIRFLIIPSAEVYCLFDERAVIRIVKGALAVAELDETNTGVSVIADPRELRVAGRMVGGQQHVIS